MRVLIQVYKSVEVNRAAKTRRTKCEAEGLCLACLLPLSDGSRTIRGVHERCNQTTLRLIARGETTEEQRIAEGKWLEKNPGGRKPSSPVTLDVRKMALS
jgi:hypothetical protein